MDQVQGSLEQAALVDAFGQYQTLLIHRSGPIVQVTLNRPDRLNALNEMMIGELFAASRKIENDDTVRAVIITGAGRAFCAGADKTRLAERAVTAPAARPPAPAGLEGELIAALGMPVVAAINGAAAGAGMGLALVADFRIAAQEAFFVEAHVVRGLTPSVASWYLPRMVGLTKAMEIVMLGDRVAADEALRCGLVNKVVPAAELLPEAWALASRLAELPPLTARLAKASIQTALVADLDATRRASGWSQLVTKLLTQEHLEGTKNYGHPSAEC